jgi:L-histidine Nalpha-methyltransferase
VPFWDGRQERIDMRLRACEPERARLDALDLDLDVAAGEEIRIEISSKFREEGVRAELADVGFEVIELWRDANDDFGVALAKKRRT